MVWSYRKLGLSTDHQELLWSMHQDYVEHDDRPCDAKETMRCINDNKPTNIIETFIPISDNKQDNLLIFAIIVLLCAWFIYTSTNNQRMPLYLLLASASMVLYCHIQSNNT